MNTFRGITILLTLIVLLPVLFFSVFEISRFNKTEKELLVIYNKQLDAILFSINLYSEDIINSWTAKLSNGMEKDPALITRFLNTEPRVSSLSITGVKDSSVQIFSVDPAYNKEKLEQKILLVLKDSAARLNRMTTYYRGGYRKIEPLALNSDRNKVLSFFFTGKPDSAKLIVMEINARNFITELLGPKIQSTAENRMNIGIVDNAPDRLIYSVGNLNNPKDLQARKTLWLFPQYDLGVSLRDHDLISLSKENKRLALYLILAVDFLFLLAGFLIFRNIRKEIKLAQIKSEFTSNVSHEIRTPLSLISMYAETLEMERVPTEEKKKEYYRVIYNETQRLAGIVNRILSFSRLESGRRTFEMSAFNLNMLVDKILSTYSFHIHAREFDFKTELLAGQIMVRGDFEALSDVFLNILDNAIKYSPNQKSIEIKTGIRGNYGYFEIIDKGIGIAPEHRKLIFDKYYRVTKGNLASITKGTGLGLTIVRNIVEHHQGKTEVESKLGEGSTFRVLIPLNT